MSVIRAFDGLGMKLLYFMGWMRWVVWGSVGILFFAGCEQTEAPSPHGVLRIGVFSPYTSLDPIYARDQMSVWLVQQLFMGLFTYDERMNLKPAAVRRWEVSPDGQEYRFYLRTDLPFVGRGGRYLRAGDVIYSWHRLADPRWASPGSYLFRGLIRGWEAYQQGKATTITGLRQMGDSLLIVELEMPYAPFLHLLTLPYAAIVLPEAAESLGRGFGQAPIGLGPFRLIYQQQGRLVVFKCDTGSVRKIVFRWYPNRLWAWEALRRGEIDAFEGSERALEYQLSRDTSWQREVQRLSIPQLGIEYLGMDTRPGSPFADREIRRALRAVIWSLSLKEALKIDCTPARTFLPPLLLKVIPEDTITPVPAALERLRQMPITLYAAPAFRELCEYLQNALARSGIQLRIEYLLGPSLREQIAKGYITFWKASWLADFPEGENFLILFESSQTVPKGPNTTRFSHPLMDSLVARSRRTLDVQERRELYTQAERLLLTEAPVIPLYHAHGIWHVSRRVRNFPTSALPVWLPLSQVQLEEK